MSALAEWRKHLATFTDEDGATVTSFYEHPIVRITEKDAAAGADIVLSCVGDDPDVLEVALGSDGAIPAMREGALYIDNSTVSADVARKLAAAGGERGVGTLDAPVSGGQAGAENGKLTVMVGGAQGDFDTGLPGMRCYGARVVRMGEAGTGQTAKLGKQR